MIKRLSVAFIMTCVLMLTGCGDGKSASTVPASETAKIPVETEGKTSMEQTATQTEEQTAKEENTDVRTEEAATEEAVTEETSTETGNTGASKYYSDADIEEAKEAARSWTLTTFEGAEIKEVYYPGDDFTERFSRAGASAFDDMDNSMVLGGFFVQSDGTERGVSGYPLWVWILRRSGNGGWTVMDAGK